MNKLELRKILIVGYTFDAPEGAPLLDGDGLPASPVDHPIRMRVAFWVPQREPFRRRDVRPVGEYLAGVVAARAARATGQAVALDVPAPSTLAGYMRQHGLESHLMNLREAPAGYTMVVEILDHELQALRDGAIEEQIQDFTFPRQPTMAELRSSLMPHWEQRTLASLGFVPNNPPEDKRPNPRLLFSPV